MKAYIDEHTLTATAGTAQEAFAKAVEWRVTEGFSDITISDGFTSYSIDEFSSVLASLRHQ